MKTKLLSLFILSLFLSLQGCSSTPSTPSVPPLERAVNFEKGISKIPEGNFIFIEFRSSSVCSDECNCAPEAPAPLYEFTSTGELWIERELGVTSTGELWIENDADGLPTLSAPILGFFVFDDWGGQVYVMDTLPFELKPGIAPSDTIFATVYSVDAEGTAVVEVFGETYFIKPGQAWTDSGDVKQEPPAGCRVSYSTGLTNFGLFPQTQIRFGFPNLHP